MMAGKRDPYASPGMKLLGLYGLLLFSGRTYSLPQLAEVFRCSKQTILRMMEQIELTRDLQVESWIEGGRKWYRAPQPRKLPNVTLDVEAFRHLLLCRDLIWHLLPPGLREEIGRTVSRATVLLPDFEMRTEALPTPAVSYPKGAIDYAAHEATIATLLAALREHRICEVSYRADPRGKTKRFALLPLRLIAYREGLYIIGRLKKALEHPQGFYDPLLALHRIVDLAVTEEVVDHPPALANGAPETFGLMQGSPFRVIVSVKPEAAAYVRERCWSADQAIEDRPDGGVVVHFTATDRSEVKAWILSFGPLAELLSPADLRAELAQTLRDALALYNT